MTATTLWRGESLAVYDYRCSAGPSDRPFVECHASHSISYVRQGSFGVRTRGQSFEMVAGAVLVGHGSASTPSATSTRGASGVAAACRRCLS
jgi:AraC family transcriptional regulator